MTQIKRMDADFFSLLLEQTQIFLKAQSIANLAIFTLRALRSKLTT